MKKSLLLICLGTLLFLSACNSPESIPTPATLTSTPHSTPAETPPPATQTATVAPTVIQPTSTIAPTAMPASPTPTVEPEQASTFAHTFGGSRRDRGINLVQASDGGFAIIGYTSSFGAQREDIYLVRIDGRGELLWSKTYGGASNDNGWAILETADQGFVILGFTDSFGAGEMDIYLLRVDQAGQLLWERTFGGEQDEFGWDLTVDPDGGYVIAGQTDSFGSGEEDGYLLKVDAEGNELWSQTFGGEQEDRLFSVTILQDGGFALAGTTRSFGAGQRDAYIVLTDSEGNLGQEQYFGEAQDDVAHAVRQTDDGGYFVTGYTRSFGAESYDVWVMQFGQDGSLQWEEIFGGAGDDRTIYGEPTSDGGYIVSGFTQSFDAQGWDVFLLKLSAQGDVIWQRTIGGQADDTGYTVHEAIGQGFIVTGETYSFGEGNGDMYVILVDYDGQLPEP